MLDARIFDNMAEQLGKVLPAGVGDLKSDFEQNAKAVMQGTLSKMDLVTREEFDVQAAVLQKTIKRLKALEERVIELEESAKK